MTLSKNNGIINLPSHYSVDRIVDKVRRLLEERGVTLFAVIDHSGDAERAGLTMPPAKLLISYNSSAYLQERHGIPTELLQNIEVVEKLAAQSSR